MISSAYKVVCVQKFDHLQCYWIKVIAKNWYSANIWWRKANFQELSLEIEKKNKPDFDQVFFLFIDYSMIIFKKIVQIFNRSVLHIWFVIGSILINWLQIAIIVNKLLKSFVTSSKSKMANSSMEAMEDDRTPMQRYRCESTCLLIIIFWNV